MQDMEAEHKAEKEKLVLRIKELSVENSTNLNHCNKHYKDLLRAQTKIADLKHDLEDVKSEANALSAELAQIRGEIDAMILSPWCMFKGFVKAVWNTALHRERRAEIDRE